MLNRSSIFALAAISTLAVAALAPTSASAHGFGGGGGGGGGGHSFGGGAHFGGGMHLGGGTRFGGGGVSRVGFGHNFGRGFPGRIGGHCIDRCGGIRIGWWHPHFHPWLVGWHHTHWGVVNYETPAVVDTAVAATSGAAPCTCLSETHLDDGSVLFRNNCTKEQAMATPDELRAQAQGTGPTVQ